MALSLSTLTSPSNSSVLQEINTTADFLEGVPLVKNNARGSQAGGSAKQDVALNQPRALPLDVNGKGYCYLPVTTGNAPAVTFPTIGSSADFVLEMDVYIVNPLSFYLVSGASHPHRFLIDANRFYFQDGTPLLSSALVAGASTIKIERSSGTITLRQDGALKASGSDSGSYDFTHLSFNGQFSTSGPPLNGYIQKVTLSIGATEQLKIDFNDSKIPHGASKFKCATNQVVTINTSGLDTAKIIKRPVLRFDGVNDFMQGLLNQTIPTCHMFAAFSVLGDGGEAYGRLLGLNATGNYDYGAGGVAFRRNDTTTNLMIRYNQNNITTHSDFFDDERGDYLLDVKVLTGSQQSKVNNADLKTGSVSGNLNASGFTLASTTNGDPSANHEAAIDLEFLALFNPDSIPDDKTAKKIRDYINGRGAHPIFTLIDSAGYYFYDATRSPAGAISSGSSAWSGRVVGSDNGDSASLLATQATSNDAPVGDGYVVTFADNSDHLDIPQVTLAAGDSYAWMVCGTSLGTFAYKVTVSGETELNLLGHLGDASLRRPGDLYGVMLLPLSASSADIESAKRLLIDRGAAESATASNYYASWYTREDIVEFGQADTSNIIDVNYAWYGCNNMTKFPPLDLSNSTSFYSAFNLCSALTLFPAGAKLGTNASNVHFGTAWRSSGLTSFPALDLSTGVNFTSAWQSCSALTTFPAGAKLGTAASNVNFTAAWQSSGLTSFPALDLSKANDFAAAWKSCLALTTIDDGILLGTASNSVNFTSAFKTCTALTTLPSNLDLSKGDDFQIAFQNCQSLVNFPANAFDTMGTPLSSCFVNTWDGCTALSANSVENILVSIDTSGQSAPSSGPQITIDYNTATGSLSAATNTAVSSLKGRGWSIIVNNVTL